jgi:hypothetical protein
MILCNGGRWQVAAARSLVSRIVVIRSDRDSNIKTETLNVPSSIR